jgi:Ca2+-binding RTX toxin-like protein
MMAVAVGLALLAQPTPAGRNSCPPDTRFGEGTSAGDEVYLQPLARRDGHCYFGHEGDDIIQAIDELEPSRPGIHDLIRGGQGNDYIFGGRGRDVLVGAAGDDELRGGRGNDELWDGPGADAVYGGPGWDVAYICDDGADNEIHTEAGLLVECGG